MHGEVGLLVDEGAWGGGHAAVEASLRSCLSWTLRPGARGGTEHTRSSTPAGAGPGAEEGAWLLWRPEGARGCCAGRGRAELEAGLVGSAWRWWEFRFYLKCIGKSVMLFKQTSNVNRFFFSSTLATLWRQMRRWENWRQEMSSRREVTGSWTLIDRALLGSTLEGGVVVTLTGAAGQAVER